MLNKFKNRWNIKSNFQLLLILFIFSVTGSASLIVKTFIFGWMGINGDTSLWLKIPLYVLVIFPAYQLLFLLISTMLGQFRFAWNFEKKVFSHLKFKK
jgi:hypothetical protein